MGADTAETHPQSMIRSSANRFSVATGAERGCAEIMLKQEDAIILSIAS